MSTDQNYVGKGDSATTPPLAAQNAAQQLSTADIRPYLDGLLLTGHITNDERQWSTVIPVTDDTASPLLQAGGYAVAYLLDLAEYKAAVGKWVAVCTKTAPDTYSIGLMQSLSRRTVRIKQNQGADLAFHYGSICQLFRVIYAVNPALR